MNKNFELSKKLRMYLDIACNWRSLTLGEKCPLSIRKRYTWSQSIIIYPEADYDFFLSREAMRYLSLAVVLGLDSSIDVENGLPVITISDYNVKNK